MFTRWLSETFNLSLETNGPDAIIIDFYYYNLVFAEECGFTAEKISTFFSIMKQTLFTSCCLRIFLSLCIYSIWMNSSFLARRNCNSEEVLNLFKQLLTSHSVHRPPFSVQIFSFEDVARIADYAVNRFLISDCFLIYSFFTQLFWTLQTISICLCWKGYIKP